MTKPTVTMCFECIFWDSDDGDERTSMFGICQRYAPKPVVESHEKDKDPRAHWPKTAADEGCGEGVEREE